MIAPYSLTKILPNDCIDIEIKVDKKGMVDDKTIKIIYFLFHLVPP